MENANPQPRIDESGENRGVPFCTAECTHFMHPVSHAPFCKILVGATVEHTPCLPAVRQMEARIRELEERFRPKTVEELLDECRKWQLTDEELEQLQ